jgi:hypothetical protein
MTFQVLEDVRIETPEGLVTLNQGQTIKLSKDEAILLIEAGLITPIEKVAYKIYSKILQAYLWVVDTDQDMHTLRSSGITEAIYTPDEIPKLKGLDKDTLKEIHQIKATFPESSIKEISIQANKKR